MDDSYGTANTGGASLRAGDDAHSLSKADKPAVAATPASHSMANGEEPELTGWRLALSRVAGLGLMAGSACTFSVVTLMVSLISGKFTTYEITAVRFFTQWLCSAITIVYEYKAHNVSLRVGREFWAGMAARLVFGVLSMVFFYLALQHLAMANASVIRFTSPAMVSVLAFFLYKEEFGWVQGISTVMSMAGVVLVAQPHFIFGSPHVSQPSDAKGGGGGTSAQQDVAIAYAFAAAVAAAFAFLAIRRVNAIHPMVTTFWFSLFGFVALAPVALIVGDLKMPHTWGDAVLLCGTGVVGYLGQWFMCRSLQLEEAGPATMMRYLDVAFAYLFQIVIEHRAVDWLSPVGALMVVSGAAVVTIQRWCWPATEPLDHAQADDEEAAPLITPASGESEATKRWHRAARKIIAVNRVRQRNRAISLPERPVFPGHRQRSELLHVTARPLVDDF